MAGSLAGSLAYTVMYPIDYTWCMISINKVPSDIKFINIISYLWKRDGFLKFYWGLSACILGAFPYCGLKFFFFEYFKKAAWVFNKREELTKIENLFCGSLAGISACTISYPLEVLRKRW